MTPLTRFYVYESWIRPRVRIHRADCGFCNDGAGFRPIPSALNGRWIGPYASREEAYRSAEGLGRTDTGPCAACRPDLPARAAGLERKTAGRGPARQRPFTC
jgi:hypothetical protein